MAAGRGGPVWRALGRPSREGMGLPWRPPPWQGPSRWRQEASVCVLWGEAQHCPERGATLVWTHLGDLSGTV